MGSGNPGDRPGSVAVSLFLDNNEPQLLQLLIDVLTGEGFSVDTQTSTSVLMKRGYSD
jgi:hypothetical protein